MTIKATVHMHGNEAREYIGDTGAFDVHSNWWMMIKDEIPIVAIPRDNIDLIEYEKVEEAPAMEYQH